MRYYSYYTAADSNQYAILPRTDSNLYPLSNIMLSFNMRAYSTSTSYGAVAIVGVITNPADARTFVPVDTVNSNGVTIMVPTVLWPSCSRPQPISGLTTITVLWTT